jgi:Family of unknown function (DUF6186)
MNATALWLVVVIAGACIELIGRLRPNSVASLRRGLSMSAEHTSGRVLLIVFWLFVGVHLFARYTLPHH